MADNRTATLALDVTSDAGDAARDVEDVADAYADLAKEIDRAGDVANAAGSKLDGVTESADGLASTSSAATGALGALSSGFDLVGLEQYSGALQGASMATDFLSGVGDSLTLVLGNQKVATIASTVASKATTAATKAQAIAQRALNVVMRANPIGLIITAVLALIAGFVLLYKRSETFRKIVDEVGRVGKEAIQKVVDVVGDLVSWVKDKIPDAFQKAKDLVVRYIELVTTPQRKLLDLIKEVAGFVKDKIPEAFETMKGFVTGALDAVLSPFTTIKDAIQDILDLIGKIKLPSIDLNPLNKTIAPPVAGPITAGAGGGTFVQIPVNVGGIIGDEDRVIAAIQKGLERRLSALGINAVPALTVVTA